jgi:peptide alpha-N-acetyltransferase
MPASPLELEAAAPLPRSVATLRTPGGDVSVSAFEGEHQIASVMALICKDLSEPYSIFTFRYFLDAWPEYCLLAHAPAAAGAPGEGGAGDAGAAAAAAAAPRLVGAILCKASPGKTGRLRGYVGMFAVDAAFRRCGIGSALAALSVQRMAEDCDEVVLETEVTNAGALRLYEGLGFTRDKLLAKYYLNGNAAFRMRVSFS